LFLLGCDSLPFTKRAEKNWQRQQEYNLQYVALTRAKQTLYLVPLPKKQEMLPDLLNHDLGGMSFGEGLPQSIEQVIPVVWHNPELLPEFYIDYVPQVGDRVTKRGLYGWEGEVISIEDERCLVEWGNSTAWEDAHNLINVVGRKLCNSNKEVKNDN
jgi:ATP-dependent exoDNAse (exonuclease V) beta subunit